MTKQLLFAVQLFFLLELRMAVIFSFSLFCVWVMCCFLCLFIKTSENRPCSKHLSTCINYQSSLFFGGPFPVAVDLPGPNGISCSEKQQGCSPVLLFIGVARNISVFDLPAHLGPAPHSLSLF